MKAAAMVLVLTIPAGALAQEARMHPRDLIADVAVESYVSATTCVADTLQMLSISQDECSSRVEAAKAICSAEIRRDLPAQLTDSELRLLVARSAVCKTATLFGRPYRNEDWVDEIEDALRRIEG